MMYRMCVSAAASPSRLRSPASGNHLSLTDTLRDVFGLYLYHIAEMYP